MMLSKTQRPQIGTSIITEFVNANNKERLLGYEHLRLEIDG